METKKFQGNVSTTGLSFRDIPSLFQRMIYNHFLPSRPCNASECRHNVQIYEVEIVWTNITHPEAHTKECIKNIKEHCKKTSKRNVNVSTCKNHVKTWAAMPVEKRLACLEHLWAELSLLGLSCFPWSQWKPKSPWTFLWRGRGIARHCKDSWAYEHRWATKCHKML